MKKKLVLVLVLAAFTAAGASAQLGIELYGQINGTSVTPTIGIDINLGGIDVLAGVSFRSTTTGTKEGEIKETNWNLGIYAGVGPKMSADRWTVSFPLLAQFGFGGYTLEPSSAYTPSGSNVPNSGFSIGFRAGAKVEFAITRNASIFTGVLLDVITYTEPNTLRWKGNTAGAGTEQISNPSTRVDFFSSGSILLGARINF